MMYFEKKRKENNVIWWLYSFDKEENNNIIHVGKHIKFSLNLQNQLFCSLGVEYIYIYIHLHIKRHQRSITGHYSKLLLINNIYLVYQHLCNSV